MTSIIKYSDTKAFLNAISALVDRDGLQKIHKAFDIAVEYCGDKKTLTGEYKIVHSLSVAKIVALEMGLGKTSIITALLHDVYMEIDNHREYIGDLFGNKVVDILEGFSRVSNIDTMQSTYQADAFKKLLLSLADDVRVILIKLIERLENMRNIAGLPEDMILQTASETYFLYAPLAHRLGYYNVKSELEDLSIKYLDPEGYEFVSNKLKNTAVSREKFIKEFVDPLQQMLEQQGFHFTVKSRTKSVHSILQKMKKQNIPFEEVYDIFAIRIILKSDPKNEKSDCWRAYSIVTDLYMPNPSRLRDWISIPKTNGYESLHTTVIGPHGRWVEVQIRTERMDEIAEKGMAAHFKYKEIKSEGGLEIWLSKMRDLLESSEKDDLAFLDQVRSGLYVDEIFVFTPKGDLRQLPAGSTVLDFAFDIHTSLGTSCVGGKVNGKNVTIKQVLKSGDHVDIIKSKSQKPKQDWLSFVVTNKAKTKIKQALNEEKVKEAAKGKEILMRRLKNWKIAYDDINIQKLLQHYNLKLAQDLYSCISEEKINLIEIKDILSVHESEDKEEMPAGNLVSCNENITEGQEMAVNDYLIIEEKVEGLDYHLAKCCNPVFGDPVFGFVTISDGIKIHRKSCPNADFLLSRYPYRIIAARWNKQSDTPSFIATIKISGVEEVGIVPQILDILGSFKTAVRNFNYNSNDGMFEGVLTIMVSHKDALYGIIRKIQTLKGILKVVRADAAETGH